MITLTRRQSFAAAAGAAASIALPFSSSAEAPRAGTQAPGFYRRRVGETEVTALLDGYLDIAHGFWSGIDQATVEELAAAAGLPASGSIRIGVTSYLINQGDRLTLVDTGSADLFGPKAGKFAGALGRGGPSSGAG